MTGRQLSPAEIRQRREARTQHGAHSEAKIRPRSEVLYRRYLKAMNKAVGPTSPAERRQLRYLARYEARIDVAEQYLADHAVQGLFLDAKSGRLHPLADRIDGWTEAASRVVARMPERVVRALGAGHEDGLGALLRRPRS